MSTPTALRERVVLISLHERLFIGDSDVEESKKSNYT